ncbi:MAG: PDZ domain-containing protein [Fimbriimonas sp.]|nr:PDZ domain-containing protein [Fimbriimonas sp.]
MSLILTSAALLVAYAQNGDAIEPRLMRTPAIYGDTVVFSYAGDLWVAKKTTGEYARRLTSHPGLEVRPKISPDGQWVAFTGQYDGGSNIYLIPITGGEPKRLTYDSEPDSCLGWTPDGKIAYASVSGNFINRQNRLWTVDPKGGLPVATKINEVADISWFPDGHTMAYTRMNSYGFNWRHYRGGSQGRISIYDFASNHYSELPSKREQSFFPMVVGKEIYYISDKANGTLNLFVHDTSSGSDSQLTKYADADIRYPSTDGKTIVFERDGYLNLFDIATRKIETFSPHIASENIVARPYLRALGNQISSISLSPSGVRVAAEARGDIFTIPVKSGDTRNLTRSTASRERYPQWSPDGKSIAYLSDESGQYEIYTRPQMGGDAVQLTKNSPYAIQGIDYTPDGKSIGIRTNDNQYLLLDVATKQIKPVLKAKYGIADLDVSPDSKWIAYTEAGNNEFAALYLYEIATGKSTKITDGYYDDTNVSFDLNGKYLYLVSSRTFSPTSGEYEFSLKVDRTQKIYVIPLQKSTTNPLTPANDEEASSASDSDAKQAAPKGPKPVAPGKGTPTGGDSQTKIDLDGIGNRMIELPIPAGNYPFVIGSSNGVFYPGGAGLMKFDLASRESTPIFSGPLGNLTFNASRSKIAYMAGGILGVIDAHPGNTMGQGKVDTGSVEATISPRDEWNQMFWEVWRFYRDNYYDSGFRGLDWNAVGKRYHAYLKYVNNRWDLSYVLGLMISELGTSHSYVMGGDFGVTARPVPVGHLGADYEADGDHVKFKKIYRGLSYDEAHKGPLNEPGIDVKEGDYLLAIDGQPVTAHTDPASLMLDKVGKGVTIAVSSTTSMKDSKQFRVFPIGSEMDLRYAEFVEGNRKRVEELSGGRIGYMHISDTATQGAIDFIRGFYPQTDKDAMIVDERWNGGGFIQPWFVDTLARKVKAMIQSRTRPDVPEERAMEGPKAMLINGYAGSGGDFFPWMFKHAKLGPLIGKRTWGGLVGINGGVPLIDGGTVTCPAFSIFDPDTNEIIAENHGIDPDIDVDLRPDLAALGQDPQLEEAVKYLLDEIKKAPAHKERTHLPVVGKDGRINP